MAIFCSCHKSSTEKNDWQQTTPANTRTTSWSHEFSAETGVLPSNVIVQPNRQTQPVYPNTNSSITPTNPFDSARRAPNLYPEPDCSDRVTSVITPQRPQTKIIVSSNDKNTKDRSAKPTITPVDQVQIVPEIEPIPKNFPPPITFLQMAQLDDYSIPNKIFDAISNEKSRLTAKFK